MPRKSTNKSDISKAKVLQVGDEPIPGVKLAQVYKVPGDMVGDLQWSPCGRFIASPTRTGRIFIWATHTGNCCAILAGNQQFMGSGWDRGLLAWSPDSMELASMSLGELKIWDIQKICHIESITDTHQSAGSEPQVISIPKAVFRPRSLSSTQVLRLAWCRNIIAIGTSSGAAFLFNRNTGDFSQELITHTIAVPALAFSPEGDALAVGHGGGILIWNTITGKEFRSFVSLREVYDVAWSFNNNLIAIGTSDYRVSVLDLLNERINSFEGHTSDVHSVSFSHTGSLLASVDRNGTLILWRTNKWEQVGKLRKINSHGVAFHPALPQLATASSVLSEFYIWNVDVEALLLGGSSSKETIWYTSAKIVLLGESNIGKSSLAMRLAENRYPKDDEQSTTHGMRFWPMEAEQLHLSAKPPKGQRRDVVLWDFGGQDEYRLIHQLFLHDTTLALILIDPTRGRAAFDEAREWNKRLEKQFTGRRAVKLLIGAKQDQPSKLIDSRAIEELCRECEFAGYFETSAKTGRNIKVLRKAISQSLDWENLGMTSRPELFQSIRDEIESKRTNQEVVLALDDLLEEVRKKYARDVEPVAVKAVSDQLAMQGVIAQTTLTGGEDVIILQLPVIERYAGSLIIAARNNPRGVPALEERLLGSPQLPLPGMVKKDRVPLIQERIVLECIAELMIRHGVCYRHQRMLVFPSLFAAAQASESEKLPHSVSLYYDFTGAIDNIYASLVARLTVTEEFGEGRLYPGRIEFDTPGEGVCGIQHIKYKGGQAHIDLFFEEGTDANRRRLFTRFVEEHLREHGIDVREHEAIKCRGCTREISEEVVHANLAAGESDVVCQWCRTHTSISEGVGKIRERDPQSDQKIYALRKEITKRTAEDAEKAKRAVATSKIGATERDEPIRILHLSDLHFTKDISPKAKLQWLLQDIRHGDSLGFDSVEYIVISGDITDKGNEEGFEKAREFVSLLNEELRVSAERCIFVPGNHDVQDMEASYDWYSSEEKAKKADPDEGQWHREGNVIFVPNKERYPFRLKKFSDGFFHKIIAKPYPLEYPLQGLPYFFPRTRIQFLTLNSCWRIDQFNRKRSGVHPEAVAHVIAESDKQIKESESRGEIKSGQNVFRIAVWHHSVAHPEMIQNTDFIGHLRNAEVRLCLHGDVHEMNRELINYWHPKQMHVAGTGSFGSPAAGRPESTPRLYNLIEVKKDLRSIRVHTRRQLKPDGAWSAWNEWPREDGKPGGVSWYDIKL